MSRGEPGPLQTRDAQEDGLYRSLFQASPQPMWVYATDSWRFLAVNEAAVGMYGYSFEEFERMTISDIRPEEDVARLRDATANTPQTLSTSSGWRHRRKDGTLMEVEVASNAIVWNGVDARVVVVSDVSARKNAEALARRAVDNVAMVLDSTTDAFCSLDPEFRISYANARAAELMRRSRDELFGRRIDEVFPAIARTEFSRRTRLAMRTQRTCEFVDYFAPLDSWFEVHLYPAASSVAIYFRDVSERIRTLRALEESQARMRLVLSQLPAIIWTIDGARRVTSVYGAVAEIGSLQAAQFVGKPLSEFSPAHGDGHDAAGAHERALRGRASSYLYQSGGAPWQCQVEPLFDSDGTIVGAIGLALDVTDKQRMQDALAATEARLTRAQEIAHLGMWEHDIGSGEIRFTHELLRLFGLRTGELASKAGENLRATIKEAEQLPAGRPFDKHIVDKDGNPRWLQIEGEFSDAPSRSFIGTVLDITERKAAQERLEFLAHHDPLTSLPNRVLLDDRLDQALTMAQRRGRAAAVLLLDLDRFKYVNDTMGHSAGDLLLVQAAERLVKMLRPDDTVSRTGGDEFVILLTDLMQTSDVAAIAQKILRAFSRPFDIAGRAIYMTPSIGISLFPIDALEPHQLISNADVAMYRAKAEGGNRFQFYTAGMHEIAVQRLALESDLRRAFARNDFEVYFQPIVEYVEGRIVGAEALVRWNHPTRGTILPSDFIGIAEDAGMIGDIGLFVMHRACTSMQMWRLQTGLDLYVAVNVSARQFNSPGLAADVRDALGGSGLPAGRLILEITESTLVQEVERVVATMRELKEIGIDLAVDDFGTGYSSLGYLKRFPIDVLKIDRSFVGDLERDEYDRTLADTIIRLARTLHLRIVAEGVENHVQARLLHELGCSVMQGFHYSVPLDAPGFEAYLKT